MNHYYASVMVFDNMIYLCGGGCSRPIADIEEYSIESDTWSTSSLKLPKPLTFFTAAMVDFV